MSEHKKSGRPRMVDHAIAALNAFFGDYLSETENGLAQAMAFYQNNRAVAPEAISPLQGKICVFVHGLASNEALWAFPEPHEGGDYGALLERRCGVRPLYLRYNTGLHISSNGRQLDALLERLCSHHESITEIILIGHSMGGLVLRSASYFGENAAHHWVNLVRHMVYLGSPHLGAPLEKVANMATHVLGCFNNTATRVIREVINRRSVGVKDLRFGNLVDEDWLDIKPDELVSQRRTPVPWLAGARHHRVVGHVMARMRPLGDAVVSPASAAGEAFGDQPGAPGELDLEVMEGLDHLALARHPKVYEHIERWIMAEKSAREGVKAEVSA